MAKINKLTRKRDDPISIAIREWDSSISKVDKHAETCKKCNKKRRPHNFAVTVGALLDPKVEAYQLCRKGTELYRTERECLKKYREMGQKLPVFKNLSAKF